MDSGLWIAMLLIALGTFLMRLLPLQWMQRHLQRHDDKEAMEAIPQWISLLGPLMIAAMFGVSLLPKTIDSASVLATVCGVLATLLAWQRTRSLGVPVFAGVLAFGAVNLIA